MAKRGGPSGSIQRALARPRQSAPARVEQEIIVIDSSSDEDDAPPPPPPKPVSNPIETINISSSESDRPPPKAKRPQSLGGTYQSAVARVTAKGPKPQTTTTRKLSLSTSPDRATLPPLPVSERNTPSPPQRSPPSTNPNAYRTGPGPSSDGDSQSSSEMIETRLVGQPEQKSVILGSGSSTSENADDERDPAVDIASPRKSAPIPSSPTPETEPEPEPLVESIANVSLYDGQPAGQDQAVAQAVEAVGNVTLGATETFRCSVGECNASFSTAGQLHQHTSRDHGIRLQQNKPGRKKRKASDEHETIPAKRRTTALPLSSSVAGSSRNTPASAVSSHASGSQTYTERKNTVGFDSFVKKVSDQESLPSDPNDLADASSSSGSVSHTPPATPPPIPNMRAPQPNLRPPVPDEPSQDLSPSKQRAQVKDEVLIQGDPLITWRVDLVNSMPDSFRKNGGVRAVFEAYMDDAMRFNEPCAPAIRVENTVDAEPCPPWEFVYYNTMVYGTNVPKPDLDALEGCDCLGPCDPENQDCACVRRQERYYAEAGGDEMAGTTGFGCAEDGTIKYQNGAVFGCNSRCSCDLECSNKVLQQGRKFDIAIRKTRGKGWGVFAKENIPAGMFIGIYTGELLTEGMASKRAPVYDEFGRTYVLNIDFHHIAANEDAPMYAVDAFHAGNFTRFFNHSCEPNMKLTAYYCDDVDIQKPLIALFTCVDVKAGSELTFSYTGLDVNDEEDREKVRKIKKQAKAGTNTKVFERCLCGAPRCFEIIFTGVS